MSPLRIGILGTSKIAPIAIIRPAQEVSDVTVTTVAARDRARAESFAKKYKIVNVRESYAEVLADPAVDAVYIPLPNSLHSFWTLRAIDAGKHVLCEKPFSANRSEAEKVAAAAERAKRNSGLVVMEAFHYRYHPLVERLQAIIHGSNLDFGMCGSGGELGMLRRVEVSMCIPFLSFSNIRYSYELAGGATMDAGCYALHMARVLARETPSIRSARAVTLRKEPRIDRAITAELHFPSGLRGQVRASLWSRYLFSIWAKVAGEHGELKVSNYVAPHFFHKVTVRTRQGKRIERVPGRSTYIHQLEAFAAAVRSGGEVLTSAHDAVVTMGLIDDVYRAAGLPIRKGINL